MAAYCTEQVCVANIRLLKGVTFELHRISGLWCSPVCVAGCLIYHKFDPYPHVTYMYIYTHPLCIYMYIYIYMCVCVCHAYVYRDIYIYMLHTCTISDTTSRCVYIYIYRNTIFADDVYTVYAHMFIHIFWYIYTRTALFHHYDPSFPRARDPGDLIKLPGGTAQRLDVPTWVQTAAAEFELSPSLWKFYSFSRKIIRVSWKFRAPMDDGSIHDGWSGVILLWMMDGHVGSWINLKPKRRTATWRVSPAWDSHGTRDYLVVHPSLTSSAPVVDHDCPT